MSGHLSAEQISSWMIGGRTPWMEKHVGDCPECRAELDRLEETLSGFRASVRAWSADQSADMPVSSWIAQRSRRSDTLRWAMAVAALVFLAAVPLGQKVIERERAARQARADAVLFEQVDAALSRTFPTPMEPLTTLVSWRPEAQENSDVKGENR